MNDKLHCCCFFGHRKIKETNELKQAVYDTVKYLIANKGVNIFCLGARVNLTIYVIALLQS